MASMVTIQPSSARVASSSGIAVFSFDFSAVARCPSTRPAWAAKALTRCRGVEPTLPERRLVFPSMATTSPFASAGSTWPTQRTKAAPNWSGSIAAKTRPMVSCDGMPCSSFRYCRSHSSFSFAQASISTKVSAPDRTALTDTTSNSIRSCSTLVACLGSRTPTQTSTSRTLFSALMENSKKTENYTNQGAVNSPFVTP
ncbi:MAG: hypothetical protein AW10_04143 [Candidatus Accumulibacter appositus]|uniref:Uncharacterized protein n=1 Tax=Candidatus Accumulibacter appositus TaxID=1454003 RepID=A0A011NMP5_9PROT|nr:MAG: hypothetical protein AW10_04143 [Candidatus Accumulibacter appositus]